MQLRKQVSKMGKVLNQQQITLGEVKAWTTDEVGHLKRSLLALHQLNSHMFEEVRQLRLSFLDTSDSPALTSDERQKLKAKIDAQVYHPSSDQKRRWLIRENSLGLSTKQKLNFRLHIARTLMNKKGNLQICI